MSLHRSSNQNLHGASARSHVGVALTISEEFVDALVERVVERVRREIASEQRLDAGFLNAKSAAAFLDVTEDALRSRVKRGEVPVHRRDGRLYFDRASLRAYVEGRA